MSNFFILNFHLSSEKLCSKQSFTEVPVVVHGAEGTDSTLLITSLAQLLLDSDSRTIRGWVELPLNVHSTIVLWKFAWIKRYFQFRIFDWTRMDLCWPSFLLSMRPFSLCYRWYHRTIWISRVSLLLGLCLAGQSLQKLL